MTEDELVKISGLILEVTETGRPQKQWTDALSESFRARGILGDAKGRFFLLCAI